MLMNILYAASIARPVLQRPTVRSTSYVTKWTQSLDEQRHLLICYIWSTLACMQEGYIWEPAITVFQCTAYTGADVAGCVETQRSMTGGGVCIEGTHYRSPMRALSRRQD